MDFEIKKIDAHDTYAIRHKVMWPNMPLKYIKLPDDTEGKHFGLFVKEKLISVLSVFEKMNVVQFRKFATLTEYQGNGYGTELLRFVIGEIERGGASKTWCNARVDKASFYHKFGLKETNSRFERDGIAYVIMEKSSGTNQ